MSPEKDTGHRSGAAADAGVTGEASGASLEASAMQGDPVAMTRIMVGIDSVNPSLVDGGAGEFAMAEQAAEWLGAWGYEVTIEPVLPNRPNVLASLGSGPRTLLLNGHLDTVGVEGMTVEPFGADSTPERVVGRGAADMKAGLATILSSAREWSDRPGDGRLVVALTCDEEHASLGMQALVDGGIQADAAVVAEPTSLAVMPAHKGFAWVEVSFAGRAAHGSRPELGVDAVRHCAAFLQELDLLEIRLRRDEPHPLLGYGSYHAGTIRGGTAWSVYPDRCTLRLERRTLPGERPDGFLAEVEAALLRTARRIPELDGSARLDLVRPATEVSGDHPLVQDLLGSADRHGVPPRIEGMTAWVDAAYLNQAGIPAVCFGPGSIGCAHAADEWVDAEEVRAGARILGDFTRRFLTG